jgi:hypothetical protein
LDFTLGNNSGGLSDEGLSESQAAEQRGLYADDST